MKILIPTYVGDIHARAVGLALERKGHEAVLWFGSDLPTRQTSSLRLGGGRELSWELAGPDRTSLDEPFDVVWHRRPMAPELPEDELHPADRFVAERALRAHLDALWELIAPDAFWVNARPAARRASNKPVQLLEAQRAGLAVPPTLCSNDPARIREFLAEHRGQTVYKPFRGTQWKTDEGTALVFTSSIRAEDLPEDDLLRLSSGIFQRKVEKAYELRLTYLGGTLLPARLLSQEKELSRLDWKRAFRDLRVEPSEPLPAPVERGCHRLMERLGLVFGCLDLVVTPEGEHVFLEVNQMGQFLWLEEFSPGVPVLDPFCEFLVRGRDGFDGRSSVSPIAFEEVVEEALRRIEEDRRVHVPRVFRLAGDDTGRSADGIARIRETA